MENTIYKDELTKSMNYLASKDNTIFVGQQIVYPGNPMSTTIAEVPKEKEPNYIQNEEQNKEAEKLYKLAAAKGNTGAMLYLSAIYYEKYSKEEDTKINEYKYR